MLEFPDEKLLNHPSHSLRMKNTSSTAFRTKIEGVLFRSAGNYCNPEEP
jgi:hypothetical protein